MYREVNLFLEKVKSIVHIGKESNNLEQSFAFGVTDDDYCIYGRKDIDDDMKRFIMELDDKTARGFGFVPRTVRVWRKKIELNQLLHLKANSRKKIEPAMFLRNRNRN